ncbi:MAG: BNR-4 repeat-containing protein [Planctomycetes bacterium]|nr:BNR-4 repeat-containing protein [Planctomycetota bacterium]
MIWSRIDRVLWVLCALTWIAPAQGIHGTTKADGYRGVWYSNQPSKDTYVYKYSGGFATYPQQHVPIAVYAPEVKRTFFVYGGTSADGKGLLHMVSYYDHGTGTVPRPTILMDKKTGDAHDNPTLSIDGEGYLWVFSNAHGTARRAYVHRSSKPWSIDDGFERITETNFSYGQPWWVDGHGFCFLHTRYENGRRFLWTWRSPDGRTWATPQRLAKMERGHYQVSALREDGVIGTAFNVHPEKGGLNARTDLYWAQSPDGGQTWMTVSGEALELPLGERGATARVRETQGELVYLKDIGFDGGGRPVILYLLSRGFESGPKHGLRRWVTSHWTGERWRTRQVTTSDHNYDFGSLYVEGDAWMIIAPFGKGPHPWTTGGEMELWTTTASGETWARAKRLTKNSVANHTYARRPHRAHAGFWALWADGHTLKRSGSRLYFCDRAGVVRRLPARMKTAVSVPERL